MYNKDMTKNPYIILILQHFKSLIWFTILGAILAFSLSLIQEKQFEASGRLIIVSRNLSLDAYLASKASERFGSILVEKIYSNAFLNEVLKSDPKINDNFGNSVSERLKNWKNSVSAKIKSASGVLELSVFHIDQNQAQRIAEALFNQVIASSKIYIGGQGVDVQIIDAPSVSLRPVRPSIPLNILIGAFIGFIGTLVVIYLFSDSLENIQSEYNIKKKKAFPPPDLPIT